MHWRLTAVNIHWKGLYLARDVKSWQSYLHISVCLSHSQPTMIPCTGESQPLKLNSHCEYDSYTDHYMLHRTHRSNNNAVKQEGGYWFKIMNIKHFGSTGLFHMYQQVFVISNWAITTPFFKSKGSVSPYLTQTWVETTQHFFLV